MDKTFFCHSLINSFNSASHGTRQQGLICLLGRQNSHNGQSIEPRKKIKYPRKSTMLSRERSKVNGGGRRREQQEDFECQVKELRLHSICQWLPARMVLPPRGHTVIGETFLVIMTGELLLASGGSRQECC